MVAAKSSQPAVVQNLKILHSWILRVAVMILCLLSHKNQRLSETPADWRLQSDTGARPMPGQASLTLTDNWMNIFLKMFSQ